jgi:hypothetical protein
MPGIHKRVLFADGPARSGERTTPSPTFSDVPLPAALGPLSPLAPVLALPGARGTPASLHTALAYGHGGVLPLVYDVVYPPQAMAPNPATDMTPARLRMLLGEPATHPPTPQMTLLCDALPFPIVVRPGTVASADSAYGSHIVPLPAVNAYGAPAHAAQFVTVHNVLVAVYAALRVALTPEEYAALAPAQQAALGAAMHRRVGAVADAAARERERRKGLKRIDFLIAAGRTRFAGLGATKHGNDVWVLVVR